MRSRLIGVTALVVAAFAVFVPWAAAMAINGSATGHTLQNHDGTYTMRGTWIDAATGIRGTYVGTYSAAPPGDYTSCPYSGLGNNCDLHPEWRICNVVYGTIEFSARGESVTMYLGTFPIHNQSTVCQQTAGSDDHRLNLLVGCSASILYMPGIVGSLTGTAVPEGSTRVYRDSFTVNIDTNRAPGGYCDPSLLPT